MIAGIIGSMFFADATYYVFLPATLSIAGIAYGVNYTRRDMKENTAVISEVAGSKKKQVEQFVSHKDI